MRVPQIGDHVLYTLEDGRSQGDERPALIIRVWGSDPTSACQLAVIADGTNDYEWLDVTRGGGLPLVWKTSRVQSEESLAGHFRYPAGDGAGYPAAEIGGVVE